MNTFINPATIAGVITVVALLGILALEYRVTWKSLFSNKSSLRR